MSRLPRPPRRLLTASSPADRLGKLGERDATPVVDDRVSQHDELAQFQGPCSREIAP
ncbi:MAG: hypothetical protein ACYDDU_04580 [Dermatophilaceae bacterium]